MKITDVRVRKIKSDGKLKAYVTVTFDDAFVIHNVKVIEGKNGFFIAMPSRRTKNGEYKDVAHPIHSDFRTNMKDVILEAYDKADEQDAIEGDDEDFEEATSSIESLL